MAETTDAMTAPYVAAPDRYDVDAVPARGSSGLRLPAISLGLWQNFGDDRALATQRAIVRRAFDRGVTHFDLANNYGPPYGSAEANFGRILASDLRPYRDELIISTKAGYDMWPGPYGDRRVAQVPPGQPGPEPQADGSRVRRPLLLPPRRPGHASGGDDGCARYRRPAGQGAVRRASPPTRRGGRGKRRRSCAGSARRCSSISRPTRCSIAGSSPSCSTSWPRRGSGAIAFSPLAQGLLTDRYLDGVPADSRAARERLVQSGPAVAGEPGQRPGPPRDRPRPRPDARPAGASPGRCATRASPPRSSGRARSRSSTTTWRRSTTSAFTAGGARRDRPVRGRGRGQPLGPVQQRLGSVHGTILRDGFPAGPRWDRLTVR